MKKIVALLLFCQQLLVAQEYKSLPFWNPNLPTDQRIDDLLGRLTLDEKVYQMINHTPAITRLGIPAYDWWNEVLHGVARTPYRVTVYPQAIAMAATWDTASLGKMADFSALEGRAVYNKAMTQGRNAERYMGLTYWTPNINIFRDPRWGRGQETYGEDPFLTSKMGASFVRNLQGSDSKYLKAAACAKHFAVHSGPEPSRHVDNFSPSNYDLWDTYLPAFRELVTKADVAGVMCAYNSFRDVPCCGNDELLTDILRKQWDFKGYVTSDCWAIDDFFKYHKTHPDAESASIDAVLHSTDIECGTDVYYSLIDAVKKGNITEAQLDVSLKRLFTIRYRLGLFDPSEMVSYAKTPESVLESDEHKAHSLKMARQSIVLLKNENNTLPLTKTLKKVVVIGPNADNNISILGNYNGIPSKRVTVLEGIKNKLGPNVEVVYEKAVNFTDDTMLIYVPFVDNYIMDNMKGVKAEYFNNDSLGGKAALVAYEKEIDHYWFEGESPASHINSTIFSARYTSYITSTVDTVFSFEVGADDGYRVMIDGKIIEDAWTRNRWGPRQVNVAVAKGEKKKLVVEFWQNEGNAWVRFRAAKKVRTDFQALAKKVSDADAIIYVGGISPQLEGEEMKVNLPGFDGGDRTSILLPKIQTELMQALQTTGKPLVFVLMSGSAIAMPWESTNVPAILTAWYGGQSAGDAVADVVFGDYNPAGRLPVTFYKSDADLPDFKSYDMSNRTYRYFKGEALYPFGYGLSYTTFKYEQLEIPLSAKIGKTVTIKAKVTNSGIKAGEEVVQLYISHNGLSQKVPIKALKGFERISLNAGESKIITFTLSPEDLSITSETGKTVQPKGNIMLSVGGGQPGIKNKTTSNVISKSMAIK